LTIISHFFIQQQFWFRLIGGFFLVYLGIRTFLSHPGGESSSARRSDLAGDFLSTLLLTLTNPMTILSFAAIFAGLGLGTSGATYIDAGMMVLGVFTGSAVWWWILSFGVGTFRDRFDLRGLRWVNRLSGIIMLGFGVAALISLR